METQIYKDLLGYNIGDLKLLCKFHGCKSGSRKDMASNIAKIHAKKYANLPPGIDSNMAGKTTVEIKSILNVDSLVGVDLSGANLTNADLEGENLEGATFAGANLAGANLAGAILVNTDFTEADLEGAYMRDADLSYADLSNADMADASLSDADLTNANLSGVDLSGANLVAASLQNAKLIGADLSFADLSNANLSNANLVAASLQNARLVGTNFTGANLTGASLQGAEMTNTIGMHVETYSDSEESINAIDSDDDYFFTSIPIPGQEQIMATEDIEVSPDYSGLTTPEPAPIDPNWYLQCSDDIDIITQETWQDLVEQGEITDPITISFQDVNGQVSRVECGERANFIQLYKNAVPQTIYIPNPVSYKDHWLKGEPLIDEGGHGSMPMPNGPIFKNITPYHWLLQQDNMFGDGKRSYIAKQVNSEKVRYGSTSSLAMATVSGTHGQHLTNSIYRLV